MNIKSELINIGQINNTFGIKGFIKLKLSNNIVIKDINLIKYIFIENKNNLFESFSIEEIKYNLKQELIIKFENLNNINNVLYLKNKDTYIVNNDNVYEIESLLTYKIDFNNKKYSVLDIMDNKHYFLVKIEFENNKLFWIPLIDKYLINIDHNKKEINVKNIEKLVI